MSLIDKSISFVAQRDKRNIISMQFVSSNFDLINVDLNNKIKAHYGCESNRFLNQIELPNLSECST